MQEQLTVWNDEADLLRRAAPPRAEWFPVPQRADSMQPLVWLLALIPILFVIVRSPWTEGAARWGLRSIKLLSADEWSEFLDPGDVAADGALNYEPPLMTWCTTGAIWCAGSSQPLAVIFPAAVCVFLIVAVGYQLARAIGGPWMGLLTAVLLATHPITQQLVQQPTAGTMGLATALTTLWCLFCHLESGPAVGSPWLWLGSFTWGLCLMSNGPLAVVCLLVVGLYQAFAPKLGVTGRRIIPLNRKAGWVDWRQWKALLIWCSIGLLVGGWWPLMMGTLHGAEFWSVWTGMTSRAPATQMLHYEIAMPLLSGFVLLGLYRLIRIVFFNEEPSQRRGQCFLMFLILVSGSMWIMSEAGHDWNLFQRQLWTAFLLFPLAIVAAGGFLEIGERQVGFRLTLFAYALGVLIAIWPYFRAQVEVDRAPGFLVTRVALILGMGLLFGLCFWLTQRFIHGDENRQRWLVQGGIWGLLIAHCVWGVNDLSVGPLVLDSVDERPLLQFWSDLRTWRTDQPSSSAGDELILVAARTPSSRLHYIVQSVWPRRTLKFSRNWDGLLAARRGTKSRIVITYGKREVIRPNTPGQTSAPVPIVPPRIYDQAELTAYELKDEGEEIAMPNPLLPAFAP